MSLISRQKDQNNLVSHTHTHTHTEVTTVCPRSHGPFDIVSYYIKWVKTSCTNCTQLSIINKNVFFLSLKFLMLYLKANMKDTWLILPYNKISAFIKKKILKKNTQNCPRKSTKNYVQDFWRGLASEG